MAFRSSDIGDAAFADGFAPGAAPTAGMSPAGSKPLASSARATSIIEMCFIFAPFGIVITLPTEFSIAFFVTSVKPRSAMISLSSGYCFTRVYTD